MSKNSELKGLRGESSQSNSSKSLLNTINTGFDDDSVQEPVNVESDIKYKTKSSKHPNSILENINTGFDKPTEVKPIEKPELVIKDHTIKTCNGQCKGEIIVNENIIPNVPTIVIQNKCDEDSVINNINTGFGSENTITIECKKPKFKTHLCKESYLGEFESEHEKNLVRTNIQVYSKDETNLLIEKSTKNLVTKEVVKEMVKDLDYTTSRSNFKVNYEVPDNLFK